jgi:hypothetical protein
VVLSLNTPHLDYKEGEHTFTAGQGQTPDLDSPLVITVEKGDAIPGDVESSLPVGLAAPSDGICANVHL